MPQILHTAEATAAPRVQARGIVRAYGGRTVLDGVDIVRATPGIVGLVGPNGAGKTTLLRILAQLLTADSGTVELCGRTVERGDDAQVRALVGWVPHAPLAWLDDTVEANLRYAGRLAGQRRPDAAQAARYAIERWDLAATASTPVRRLSRGWQQRYALARADLLRPPILLLDEPTVGLDAQAREQLDTALSGWRTERIVIVASHERDWLDAHADELLELEVVS